jgi:hypothetical protein
MCCPGSGGHARLCYPATCHAATAQIIGIRFLSLLPDLTDATGLGAAAVAGYARRLGVDVGEFRRRRGPRIAPEKLGRAVLDLARGKTRNEAAHSVTAAAFEQLD